MTDAQLQQKRLAAAGIDVAVMVVLGIIRGLTAVIMSCMATRAGMLGVYAVHAVEVVLALVGLGYVLARDVVAGDRSLGKKLMNIRVVRTSGEPIGIVDSVKRNAIFSIAAAFYVLLALLGLIPIAGGCIKCLLMPLWVLTPLVALGAAVWEIIQITSQPEGTRLGDNMAGTRVTW
jgi:uncharacterized RDD family membrane protein YckC